MSDESEQVYSDGEVVWVKLGSCWWPGEVVCPEKLPPDLLPSFRKPPIAVVKFFQEDTYEYVKNTNLIYKYNCSRKTEFIKKGLDTYRTKHGHMEKFPEDVIRAETATGGDIEILTRDEFQEMKKESYAGLFGTPAQKTPISPKKGKGKRGRPSSSSKHSPNRKINFEKSDYKVHILVQSPKSEPTQSSEKLSTPSTSCTDSEAVEEKTKKEDKSAKPVMAASTPTLASGIYSCHACPFTTIRLNVMILHNKTHSATFTPYTPSPVKKKLLKESIKSTPNTSKPQKVRRPRSEKVDKSAKKNLKRSTEESFSPQVKKIKTDEEIKSSLLADWDDFDEELNDESSTMVAEDTPSGLFDSESSAMPTQKVLLNAQVPNEPPEETIESNSNIKTTEKQEPLNDCKYEFCEDEDWHVEADAGRKIPRVKNPSKQKDDRKSLSLDENNVAREVAELLSKTTVPDLPSAPEPLKIEENFPEPPIVKSPDKKSDSSTEQVLPEILVSETQSSKPTIFKTKTFFRSRHSRSQDAIGKYVAEQLNAAERMDISESEINGSELVSSPEARESPPVEQVKVARLAPKIQLKKMKAEALQLKEKVFTGESVLVGTSVEALQLKEKVITGESVLVGTSVEALQLKEKVFTGESVLVGTSVEALQLKEKVFTGESGLVGRSVEALQLKEKVFSGESVLDATSVEALQLKEKVFTGESVIVGTSVSTDNLSIHSENDSISFQSVKNYDHHPTSVSQDIKMSKDDTKDLNDVSNKETPETTSNKEKISEVSTKNESNEISNKEVLNQICGKGESYDLSSEKESQHVSTEEESIEISKNEQSSEVYTTKDIEIKSVNEDVINEESTKNIVQLDLALPENLNNSTVEQTVNQKDVPEPIIKFSEPGLSTPSNNTIEPYMNESTASAVDALLSVSRKTDRVTKVVSDDPPEDLFDDDNETSTNGYNENLTKVNEVIEELKIYNTNSTENMNKLDLTKIKSAVEKKLPNEEVFHETISKSKPSESDLQIAETLLNLPSTPIQNTIPNELPLLNLPATAIQNKIPSELHDEVPLESCQKIQIEKIADTPMTIQDISVEVLLDKRQSIETKLVVEPTIQEVASNQNLNVRFETEQEKSENLNAAQSLVQMSESIDHSINVVESNSSNIKSDLFTAKPNNGLESIEEKLSLITNESITKVTMDTQEIKQYESSSPKLLKILEEPCVPKVSNKKSTATKQLIVSGREKILNFDVNRSTVKSKSPPPKQKIIIRRTPPNKTLNSFADAPTPDKIILSRDDKLNKDGSSVQTYTIKTTSEVTDPKTIVIQPKLRKIKSSPKLQKVKQHPTLVPALTESRIVKAAPLAEDSIFDINSMPIVLSDDILTPENIEKMPIVMSDGNIVTNPSKAQRLKSKAASDEKTSASVSNKPELKSTHKPEMKTLLMNPVSESTKVTTPTTPNILSKSSKLRGAKPMLVIDKTTGKQKIIMTKSDTIVKEINITHSKFQPIPQNTNKTDKFIILPSASSPRPQGGRTQKIVIDPQAGKAHVIVAKNTDSPVKTTENKSVAKFIPAVSDVGNPTNTVMIITNAQGAQSRIVLTPEHEKILFPNKHQGNVTQIKNLTQRVTTQSGVVQKTVFTTVPSNKTNPRIVPKQPKSAIITSKGQLIVGGRVTTTGQNVAQMPEIRPAPKRIVATEPKKIIQTLHKTTSEPMILLQQKSGSVMQLTAAQFEHLQRTGQIVHKSPAPVQENKIIMKKTITVPAKEPVPAVQKPRIRKLVTEAPMPAKKLKHEIVLAPVPPPLPINTPIPALTPLSNAAVTSLVPSVSNNVPVCTTSSYPELDNFEELLPSTAIVRPNEPPAAPLPEPAAAAPPAPLSDGQLLAVPGEHFGGPHGSFYLCVEDSGTLTPIDNRPLVLENNQLVPMVIEPAPVLLPPPERRDILEAALANSDVFHADSPRDEAPDFRDLNANVSVHCRVSETSTTLNQPIMTPVEVPTKVDIEPTVHSNLEDGLAVIGVTPPTVPTSLELPITVTDPRIAPKTTDPLSGANYGTTLLTSPCTEMSFVATEEAEMSAVGPISMPLLTEEDSVGKSMPLLTDDVITERTVSSVESTIGSPSSAEEGGGGGAQWARRLLTPSSDTSETSAEIPLQPSIQLSVNDFTRHS